MANAQLKERIREVLNDNVKARPQTRAPEENNQPSDTTEYYYDTLRYSSTNAAKNKAESVFSAQNTKILGMPHQFLPSADFRIDEANNFGFNFAKDIFMERPIVTLMPGKVNYLPDYSAQDKKVFGSLMKDMNNENSKSALEDLISDNTESRFYDFVSDYSHYIRYVNLMCRVAAVDLGIENNKGPDGKTPYIRYDWANYQNFVNYESPIKDDKGVFDLVEDVSKMVQDKVKQLGTDVFVGYRQYVHFYVDPSTSVNETMSNVTQKSQLEGQFDSMEGIIKEATMLLSSASSGTQYFQQFAQTAGEGILSLANTATFGLFKNLLQIGGKEVINGANLIYPEIWMDSEYSKSYTIQLNLVSPYGNKESIYLNCLVPMIHALAFALPRQSTANSFVSPFIVRGYSKGRFSCDMGIVESISIDKGPEQSWSIDGLPTQLKITMNIKDLYSQLMMSPSNKPSLFFANQGMMDYLGSMCGVDLTTPNVVFKINHIKALLAGINDIPSNMYRDMTQSLYNRLSKFTN